MRLSHFYNYKTDKKRIGYTSILLNVISIYNSIEKKPNLKKDWVNATSLYALKLSNIFYTSILLFSILLIESVIHLIFPFCTWAITQGL